MPSSDAVYEVRALPNQHQLEVRLRLHDLPSGDIFLEAPTWVPGAYGFMKYARDLMDLSVVDLRSWEPLKVTREGWSGFKVHGTPKAIEVSYRAYCWDPAWGELIGLVGHDQAVLLGTRYLYLRGHEDRRCRVTYDFPRGWFVHHPAGAIQSDERTWIYPNYKVLLDTPVVAGSFDVRTRSLDGVAFHHVFLDKTVGYESEVEGFIDALMKVAAEAKRVFGSFPFEHYTYVFSFSPTAHWGLEHQNATMIGLGESCLIDDKAWAGAVRVAAHELFHAWNVCRLRPAPFERMDHARGSFTDGLWVAEGFTRYYEFLLSVRAGEITPETFVSNVVNYHRHLTALPAYARTSAADSSRATFLNHNRYPGSVNSTIDYYDKGMLIAFDLDATLRLGGKGATLDETFARFYDAFVGKADGFTYADLRGHFEKHGPALGELLDREVDGLGGLTTASLFERLGFELKTERVKYLGLVLKENAGPVVENVLDDAPAAKTGLAPQDEILRVNGFPFSLKGLQWLIARGEPVTLDVKRGHRFFSFEVAPGERPQTASLTWTGTDEQLALWRAWLSTPSLSWMPGQNIGLLAYDNFHGVQTIL